MSKSTSLPLARRRFAYRFGCLGAFSTICFFAIHGATAGDLLRGGASGGDTRGGGAARSVAPPQGAAQARANAKDALARTTRSIQAVEAMQAAARNLARSGPNNLGLDPNNPGKLLPNVPNGLTAGGLQVAPGVPANLASPQPGENAGLWKGAALPKQTVAGGKTNVTIKQTAQQAILNWKTFNIGKETSLKFDQSAGGNNKSQWTAFNKIADPSGSPSQILGSIDADGQVFVINSNGIIFGGSSQVNLHTLVASSLQINDNLISRGLLNNPDSQFLFSALPVTAGSKGTPAFTPDAPLTPDGRNGAVTVQKGATISSPVNAANVGGRVALIGANVKNEGTISTPSGQTILGAGLQVGVAAHSSDDPSLRGLDVYVGKVTKPASGDPPVQEATYAGTATNSGIINAARANVTMAGKQVNQLGVINSSTSVSLNGRIDLNASYGAEGNTAFNPSNPSLFPPFVYQSGGTGTVTLGPESVTQILPEWNSTEKVVGTRLAISSRVKIEGKAIHLGKDSTLFAPSADVTINAGVWDFLSTPQPTSTFISSGGQIYLDTGALINVAGSTDVSVPVTDNILTLQLRGAEFADSPLQRFGFLRGQSVTVDLRKSGTYNGFSWVGTPLANLSGYLALIQRDVGSLTTAGGTVSLNSGESVVLQLGSKIDVSGGFINYQGATVQTTSIASRGRIIDIADAGPDVVHEALYTGEFTTSHQKYGVTDTFAHPLILNGARFEDGYTHGAGGGALSITSPSMIIEGSVLGRTVLGERQRTDTPAPSALSLVFEAQRTGAPNYFPYSPTPPRVVFEASHVPTPAAPFKLDATGNPVAVASSRKKLLSLSADLVSDDGFGFFILGNPDGNVEIPEGLTLSSTPGGSMLISGANISIAGGVSVPGGSLSLYAPNLSPSAANELIKGGAQPVTPAAQKGRGGVAVASTGMLRTAGLIIDDRPTSSEALTKPVSTSFVVNSTTSTDNPGLAGLDYKTTIVEEHGTRVTQIDTTNGKTAISRTGVQSTSTNGTTGDVTLVTSTNQSITVKALTNSLSNGGSIRINSFNASLAPGGSLDVSGGVFVDQVGKIAYGTGGSISVLTGRDLNIRSVLGGKLTLGSTLSGYSGAKGGSLSLQATAFQIGDPSSVSGVVSLTPAFFSEGGFASFALTGLGVPTGGETFLPAISIGPDVRLAPTAIGLLANLNTASDTVQLSRYLKPEGARSPVSLSFNAPGTTDFFTSLLLLRGDIVLDRGATISTDALATVAISGQTVLTLGSISAPGGSIAINGANSFPFVTTGGQTRSFTTVYLGPDSVLSTAGKTLFKPDVHGYRKGTVLDGGKISVSGNIVAMPGSTLDVSGTTQVLDLPPSFSGETVTLTGSSASNQGVAPVRAGALGTNRILPTYLVAGVDAPLNGSLLGTAVVPTRVDSNAGSISLRGGEQLFTAATLIGNAGGPSALGGSLSISSGRYYPGPARTTADTNLVVTQSGPAVPANFAAGKKTPIGQAVLDAKGAPIPGMGYVAANSFAGRGFDFVDLAGNVEFRGGVTISAGRSLAVASGGALQANATVNLAAPYIFIGQPFRNPLLRQDLQTLQPFLQYDDQGAATIYHPSPTFGTGTLNATASLIDVGNLTLQSIGNANLIADRGDIRGGGTLDIAGKLYIRAGQLYPPSTLTFTLSAADYKVGTDTKPGSIQIVGSGNRALPLSAGGTLNIYASQILQGGVVRAPFGIINIGWNGEGTAPKGELTNANVAATQALTLGKGSITSVSGIDPLTGAGILVPYGINLNEKSWIDPTGLDITSGGLPAKSIQISARNVAANAGSTLDLRGGGDLFAYRWVSGNGGTRDILASESSFAIVPGYNFDYAPYAPFNPTATGSAFAGDHGYVNSALKVGDRIVLGASDVLPSGHYTLLPARYALLPGAVLVTPTSGTPIGEVNLADGSVTVSGYRYNGMETTAVAAPPYSRYNLASAAVLKTRADYAQYTGNAFLEQGAILNNASVPRLPSDGGHLSIEATEQLRLQSLIAARGAAGGLGGLVDLSAPVDFFIRGSRPSSTIPAGALVLNASYLSSFGADSILIGGVRGTPGSGGTPVTVSARSVTVDNAGSPLTGSDIVLAAKGSVTVAPGSSIKASGATGTPAEKFVIGDSAVPGSADGALLRVSSDPAASIERLGARVSTTPHLTIGAGVEISGAGVILDSTARTTLDAAAKVTGGAVSLNSGRITIALDNPGTLPANDALVLSGTVLKSLSSVQNLSLLSYSAIDLFGTGRFSAGNLALHAGQITGFANGGAPVVFAANRITLDNSANSVATGTPAVPAVGSELRFEANSVQFGANALAINQYAKVGFVAKNGILLAADGALVTQSDLSFTTPMVAGSAGADYRIVSGGALTSAAPAAGSAGALTPGFGATVTLTGTSVDLQSDYLFPSGAVTIRATTGNATIGGKINTAGVARRFYDLIKYTPGGRISVTVDNGSLDIQPTARLDVSAPDGGGDAGAIFISVPKSQLSIAGSLVGTAGTKGTSGSLSLDAGTLPGGLLSSTSAAITGFLESRTVRDRSDALVTVDGTTTVRKFRLSADSGSIEVTGSVITPAGATGGMIELNANGSLTLNTGSNLSVASDDFDNAGKGGSVTLRAGSQTNGNFTNVSLGSGPQLEIQSGATIDVSVKAIASAADPVAAAAAAARLGKFSGTVHLRAPQTTGNTDVQIKPIAGSISGASSIVVEGYQLFDLKQGGLITNTGTNQAAGGSITASTANVQGSVRANGVLLGGNAAAVATRLFSGGEPVSIGNPAVSAVVIAPGAEIINSTGDLTLGSATTNGTADWNLATFRYGTKNAPGVLTLRSSGNLNFFNTLSDGFTAVTSNAASGNSTMWLAQLNALNPALPVNAQHWSYGLTAGTDLAGADFRSVLSLDALASGRGTLALGKDAGRATGSTVGNSATTAQIIGGSGGSNTVNRFQVIRTGTGFIDVTAGRDVQLLNQFATIYTAGARVADYTTVAATGDFVLPVIPTSAVSHPAQGALGAVQQIYTAQYSMAGGNVSISAGADITHLTRNSGGALIADSSRELPINWLYRRGHVDPTTGTFGEAGVFTGAQQLTDRSASTTWWVDFSNFFEGVGALGGGNVSLTAGRNVSNVDAVAPTNARMPGVNGAIRLAPDATKLLELGGGDVAVKAGNNIDAGVYYVQRGKGTLFAENSIVTNATRTPSLGNLVTGGLVQPSLTWLPTTLFLGDSTFDVGARGDILLGPATSPFLLPSGINNKFWYKTYFSTLDPSSSVTVSSLGGSVTLRERAITGNAVDPLLYAWVNNVSRVDASATAGAYQPWLRLAETDLSAFATIAGTVGPASLRVTSFAEDINIVGDLTLSPSSRGTLELASTGSINGLSPAGFLSAGATVGVNWISSTINLSDADPSLIPGSSSPLSYFSKVPARTATGPSMTNNQFLDDVKLLFNESGSTTGVFASAGVKQALHARGPLHLGDTEPVRLFSLEGDLSGFTLFAGKETRAIAGRDITDIAFYIQNNDPLDTSIISAGRDIIGYNANSLSHAAARAPGNVLASVEAPQTGDIQIGGPGTLEVLAGRNLDLGVGPTFADGTGIGITSIGNGRNPNLPFEGADIIASAGVGGNDGLAASGVNFAELLDTFLKDDSNRYYLKDGETGKPIPLAEVKQLPEEQQAQLALELFYLVLRQAGRDFNDPASPDFQTYNAGFSAIATMFGKTKTRGDISLTGRTIKTKSGGDVSLFAPGGGLLVGFNTTGGQAADQGVLTESGGNVSIFTDKSVTVGTSRIFTLRGGNIMIWSSTGDIAAGSASKTVQSAPPTRVLIDTQSADVATDLAGLATGGGIGVLATVAGIPPADVDLIAPTGVVDAGDAGIRSTGNLNVAAVQVLNADNISISGSSTGTPPPTSVSAPNLGAIGAANSTAGGGAQAAAEAAKKQQETVQRQEVIEVDSEFTITIFEEI